MTLEFHNLLPLTPILRSFSLLAVSPEEAASPCLVQPEHPGNSKQTICASIPRCGNPALPPG